MYMSLELKDLKYNPNTNQYSLNENENPCLSNEENTPELTEEEKIYLERRSIITIIIAFIIATFGSFHVKIATSTKFFPENTINLLLCLRYFVTVFVSLLIIRMKGKPYPNPLTIKNWKWFLIRVTSFYVGMIFLALGYNYIRFSTMMCYEALHPVFVIFLSICILGEKFRIRYLIGLLICLTGAFMIILNDRNSESHDVPSKNSGEILNPTEHNSKVILGFFIGMVHSLCYAFMFIGIKILAQDQMDSEEQLFYLGLTNCVYAFIYILLFEGFKPLADWKIVVINILSAVFFFSWTFLYQLSIKHIDLSKTTTISYVCLIVSFVLGYFILHEGVFFTDIIGSLFIVAYNIYNVTYPIID